MFTLLGRFLLLRKTPLWKAADEAVLAVASNLRLQHAASKEPQVMYCPRCGQRPDGDRRMEEARELVFQKIDVRDVRRVDVDFALAYHYWKRKVI